MQLDLPRGFSASATHCGIQRNKERLDLALLVSSEPAPAAAVFTKSLLLGAHVPVCREALERSGGRVRAIVVNAGNANCSTGPQGIEDNRQVVARTAELIGCSSEEVLFLSTGVIGAALPTQRILGALPTLVDDADAAGGADFARAIMTTDLIPKSATETADRRAWWGSPRARG